MTKLLSNNSDYSSLKKRLKALDEKLEAFIDELSLDSIPGELSGARLRNASLSDSKLQVHYLAADSAAASYATIKQLTADYITAAQIAAQYVSAESADYEALMARTAELNSLLGGSGLFNELDSVILSADTAQVAGAAITGELYTGNVTVKAAADDDSLTIAGSLLQLRDSDGRVRIQLGRDGNGDFSLSICGDSGEVFLNGSGLTAEGIPSGTITDSHIGSLSGEVISLPETGGGTVRLSDAYRSIVGEVGALTEFNNTVFEQTDSSFGMSFSYTGSDSLRHSSRIRFTSEGIELGAVGSAVSSLFTPTGLFFRSGGEDIAYIDAGADRRAFSMENGEIRGVLKLATGNSTAGHYAALGEADGGLSVVWME